MIGTPQRKAWRGHHPHKGMRMLTHMACLDCGHAWWTTLVPKLVGLTA